MADTRTPRQANTPPRMTKPPLSTAEEAKIRALFDEMDEDGSGELDQGEIEAMLVKMGRTLTKAEVAGAMAEMDIDGSGDVDFAEFRGWYLDQKLGTSNKFSAMVSEKARTKFNGAGLPRKWSGPKWLGGGSGWENAIEEEGAFDPDGAAAQVDSMEVRRVRKLFKELDLDGSGALDRSEVTALIRSMGESLKAEEVDVAMREMDADGSGEVDFEEFKDWWLSSAGASGKFAAMIADASLNRFNTTGLPKMWRGPSWTAAAEPTTGQEYGRGGGAGAAGSDGRVMVSTGTQERQTAKRQRAVREWASRTLHFDPSLARSHQGLPLRTLQQAYLEDSMRLYQKEGGSGAAPPPPPGLGFGRALRSGTARPRPGFMAPLTVGTSSSTTSSTHSEAKWFRYGLVEAAMDSGATKPGLGTINSGGLSYERWDDAVGAASTVFCAVWRQDGPRGSKQSPDAADSEPQRQDWRRPEQLTEAELQHEVKEWAKRRCEFDTALLPPSHASRSMAHSSRGRRRGGAQQGLALQPQGASIQELRKAFEADTRIDLSNTHASLDQAVGRAGGRVGRSAWSPPSAERGFRSSGRTAGKQGWFAAGMAAAAAESWRGQNATEGVCSPGSAIHLSARYEVWDDERETMVTRFACTLLPTSERAAARQQPPPPHAQLESLPPAGVVKAGEALGGGLLAARPSGETVMGAWLAQFGAERCEDSFAKAGFLHPRSLEKEVKDSRPREAHAALKRLGVTKASSRREMLSALRGEAAGGAPWRVPRHNAPAPTNPDPVASVQGEADRSQAGYKYTKWCDSGPSSREQGKNKSGKTSTRGQNTRIRNGAISTFQPFPP